MGVLDDYSNQARNYDRTRSASPSVLVPLRAALVGAPGPRLADIGGGTGNYALAREPEGWEPVVIDCSSAMPAAARHKGLATLHTDAQHLPLDDASFDAAMLISMLHHVDEPTAVLAEAKRILRAGGRLAAMLYTREDIEDLWFLELFPSTRGWMQSTHPYLGDLLAQLPARNTTRSSSKTSTTHRSPPSRRTQRRCSTRNGARRPATSSDGARQSPRARRRA